MPGEAAESSRTDSKKVEGELEKCIRLKSDRRKDWLRLWKIAMKGQRFRDFMFICL